MARLIMTNFQTVICDVIADLLSKDNKELALDYASDLYRIFPDIKGEVISLLEIFGVAGGFLYS